MPYECKSVRSFLPLLLLSPSLSVLVLVLLTPPCALHATLYEKRRDSFWFIPLSPERVSDTRCFFLLSFFPGSFLSPESAPSEKSEKSRGPYRARDRGCAIRGEHLGFARQQDLPSLFNIFLYVFIIEHSVKFVN